MVAPILSLPQRHFLYTMSPQNFGFIATLAFNKGENL
jgi:hypothetical protein